MTQIITKILFSEGLTQSDLARKIEAKPSTINNWTTGKYAIGKHSIAKLKKEFPKYAEELDEYQVKIMVERRRKSVEKRKNLKSKETPSSQKERDQEYLDAKAEALKNGTLSEDRLLFEIWRREIDKDYKNKRFCDVVDGSYKRKL